MKKISLVTPFYNRSNYVSEFLIQYKKVLTRLDCDYEIIVVDDSPNDETLKVLKTEILNIPKLKIIKLSKNWGQHPAILAGLEHASGDLIALTDCDLQEDPKNLINYMDAINSGYDLVIGDKDTYKASFLTKNCSKFFWVVFNFLSKIDYNPNQVCQRLFTKEVKNAVLQYNDQNLFFGGIFLDIGYKKKYVEITHFENNDGMSSYNIFGKLSLGITFITSFSIKPLRIASAISLILFFMSFIGICFVIYSKLIYNSPPGYASLATIILFCSGMQLITIGVIGEYLGKIFSQVLKRPRYIIHEIIE